MGRIGDAEKESEKWRVGEPVTLKDEAESLRLLAFLLPDSPFPALACLLSLNFFVYCKYDYETYSYPLFAFPSRRCYSAGRFISMER